MARKNDWEREMRDETRRESWTIDGPNCLVKVVPLGADRREQVTGYMTIGRLLLGKNPQEIEGALGLIAGSLKEGARVYKFARLPLRSEYEYELTARHPGGLAFNAAHSDPRYPAGSDKIHQWEVKGSLIPVQKNALNLKPGERLTYHWLVSGA